VNAARAEVSLAEQLACVRQELRLRESTLPRWMAANRMSPEVAEAELRRWKAVVATIETLATREARREHKLAAASAPKERDTMKDALLSKPVPEGYMRNAMHHLVPVELVAEVDKLRDETVRDIVTKAEAASLQLSELKAALFGDIDAFVGLSAEKYGVTWGGDKGNVSLVSYDGTLKVVLERSEYMAFDERLQVARTLVEECVAEWTEGARSEVRALIQGAFQTDRAGRVNTRRILSLRKLDIEHPKWQRAMKAIGESLQVLGSKAYIRVYKRKAADEWDQILLDFSSVPPAEKHIPEGAAAAA
jgi:hypothetical protein